MIAVGLCVCVWMSGAGAGIVSGTDLEKRPVDGKDKGDGMARAGVVPGAGAPTAGVFAVGLDRLTAWGGDIAEGDGLAEEGEGLPAWEGVEVSGILPSMVANSEVCVG
jgi:hypothetical protein